MTKTGFTYLLTLVILFSCKKNSENDFPKGPPENWQNIPSITLIDVSPKTVQEYKDSIVFVIQYLDGDG